ncbi:MAG: transporter substrate-binding domain-containing protein [Deltaproteobacteria bacterium]|nr:transporter substrate-binding domain-containing protein [Deltaproteobacteria bacterium]
MDKEKVYKVGVDIGYPPFSSVDQRTGEVVGFDADIARAICKHIGIQCEVFAVMFDDIIPMVERGDLDIGTAGFGYTEERAKVILYTDKYYRSNSIFIQRDQDIMEITPETISGMTVAVQRGTMQEQYLRMTYRDIVKILLCNTFDDVMEAVKAKRADLGLADGIATYTYLRSPSGRPLDIAGDPVPMIDDDCLMVLNRDSVELRDAINSAIKELRQTGEYDLINLKYFDYNIY